jgi:hypothetical protein
MNQNKWSMPSVLLRIEGMAVLLTAVFLYHHLSYSWLALALLLLFPDLAIIVYAIDKKAGAIAYNVLHTYTFPLALAIVSFAITSPIGLQIALIWFAHIGMDRTVGYGLKYTTEFKDTHLNRV